MIAVLLGAVFLNEVITGWVLLAGAAIVTSVVLIVTGRRGAPVAGEPRVARRGRCYAGRMTSFDLRASKLRSGEQFQDEVEVQARAAPKFGGQRYLPVPEHIPMELRATQASTGTVFELVIRRAGPHGPCQRCLRDTVDRPQRSPPASTTRRAPDADEELRSAYVADDKLDLSGVGARRARPRRCRTRSSTDPDCAGLCPICGKDLNEEPHEHEEEHSDPRWAALEQLREQL